MRALALVLTAFLLTSCGESDITVKGTLTIADSQAIVEEPMGSGACEGTGGYDDLGLGANVVVHDASGDKLALDALMVGEFSDNGNSCTFDFKVEDVPGDQELYSISIGNREPYDFKKSEAGSLALTIG